MIESRGIFAGFMTATLMGAAILAGGCGEIAYKTGAGGDALQADQRACKQGEIDQSFYLSCMKDRGWAIADLDGGPTAPGVAPSAAPSPVTGSAQPPSPGPASANMASASPESPGPPPPAAADPLRPVKVTTWLKFGGGGPSGDIADCVATLGPANQPDIVHHTVTTALLACMRGKGWRGL